MVVCSWLLLLMVVVVVDGLLQCSIVVGVVVNGCLFIVNGCLSLLTVVPLPLLIVNGCLSLLSIVIVDC